MAIPVTTTPARDQRIGRHVQKGALDVEVAAAAAREQQRGRAVDEDADRRDPGDVPPATGTGCDSRNTASQAIPPVTTSRMIALASAARIELDLRP